MKTFLPLALTLLAVAANAAPAAQGGPLFGPPTTSSTTETSLPGISSPVPPSQVRDVRSAQFPQPSNVDSSVGATTSPPSPIHGNRPISPPFSQSEDDSESRTVRETADSSLSALNSNDSDSTVRFSSQVHNPPESPLSFGSADFNSRPVRQVPSTTTEKNVRPVRQVPSTTTERNVRPVRQVPTTTTEKNVRPVRQVPTTTTEKNVRPVRQVPTTTTEKNVRPVRQVPTTTTEKNVRPVRQVTSSTTIKTTTN